MKCKIIQDLLPLYCDKLTSQESNEEIEKHLRDCEECTQIYENMCQKEESIIDSEKDIQPLKKVRRKNIIRIIISVLVSAVVLFGVFMFVFRGIIPISYDDLKMNLSITQQTGSSWQTDENENPTDKVNVKSDMLKIVFIGDCSTIRESSDVQYIYNNDGSITRHSEITIYPVIKMPFDDRGEYPNQFEWSTNIQEGDTLTVHYLERDVTYDIKGLAEQAKKENK